MKIDEAYAMVEELSTLIPEGPGKNIYVVSRAERIISKFKFSCDMNTYVNEKAEEVIRELKIYCSDRKWQQRGPDNARNSLNARLEQLRMSIQQIEFYQYKY